MKRATGFYFIGFLTAQALVQAASPPADSRRGAQLFQTLSCSRCHSIDSKGAPNLANVNAPDLGRMIDRNFTPAGMAALMWNHAPKMWASMQARDIRPGDLTEQAAADLFAYFYSLRFFDKPGDGGRGRALFADKNCEVCHGLTQSKIPEAMPVSGWQSRSEPMALIDAMWNHSATMRTEFARRKLSWPDLTAQELADILVYVRNLPGAAALQPRLEITAGTNGPELFRSKGCAGCHNGTPPVPNLRGRTLTEIAVDMWNHPPRSARTLTPMTLEEMRELVSWLWAEQFFVDAGNAGLGRRVFNAKQCVRCHNDPSSGAPQFPKDGDSFSAGRMVSALWKHGPAMQEQMRSRNIPWPRFDSNEMADLIAFLNYGSKAK
jgi:mono/diheme cytochrome c family protein